MKNKSTIIYLLLGIVLFVACRHEKADKQKNLSVTISPQQYFLEQLVGDKYRVNCVVPQGSNPESFDFSPSQMVSLSNSAAYFKIGYLSVENTLIDKITQTNPGIKIVDCSVGIEPVSNDGTHINCSDSNHSNGHSGQDPHIWSSSRSAKIMVGNMYEALLELDKSHKDVYSENYEKLIAEINRTDSIIKVCISEAPSRSFIIYHPALSYFADEYGLKQYTIEYEGKNPSPSQLKQLIDKAKEESIKVVFIQQEYDTKNAETIANAVGAKTVPINLSNYNWNEEMIKIARALNGK